MVFSTTTTTINEFQKGEPAQNHTKTEYICPTMCLFQVSSSIFVTLLKSVL